MQTSVGPSTPLEFNTRTLKNKEGHYPSWLSGRQRKRMQAREAVQKKTAKKKLAKPITGRIAKRKVQLKKSSSDKAEVMLT